MTMSRDDFASSIRIALSEHPEWLSAALEGISSGMEGALKRMNQARARADAAFLAALALKDTKRMTPELQQSLCATVARAIYPGNMCGLERDFMANFKEAKEATNASV